MKVHKFEDHVVERVVMLRIRTNAPQRQEETNSQDTTTSDHAVPWKLNAVPWKLTPAVYIAYPPSDPVTESLKH